MRIMESADTGLATELMTDLSVLPGVVSVVLDPEDAYRIIITVVDGHADETAALIVALEAQLCAEIGELAQMIASLSRLAY